MSRDAEKELDSQINFNIGKVTGSEADSRDFQSDSGSHIFNPNDAVKGAYFVKNGANASAGHKSRKFDDLVQ